MKLIRRVLASLTLLLSAAAGAMEELEDAYLSGLSAQDGVTVAVNSSGFTIDHLLFHDTDGAPGRPFDGTLFARGIYWQTNAANPLTLVIDAGASAFSGGETVLNVKLTLPPFVAGMTGGLAVGNSTRDNGGWWVDGASGNFVQFAGFSVNSFSEMNFQFGTNEAQTGYRPGNDMGVFTLSSTSSVTISNLRFEDTNGGAGMGFSNVDIRNTSGGGLNLGADLNLTSNGIVAELGSMGTGGLDISMRAFVGWQWIGEFAFEGIHLANNMTVAVKGL